MYDLHDGIKITLNQYETKMIEDLVSQILLEKLKEKEYRKDSDQLWERWMRGLTGEFAVGKLLGENIIDWEAGPTMDFAKPDLESIGYEIGIKSSKYGNYPLIHRVNTYPQIMTIINGFDVWVMGLADVDTLNTYQDDNYIISKNVIDKGYKTAFTGFDHLKYFSSLSDLKEWRIKE